jgi:hypothetical protein
MKLYLKCEKLKTLCYKYKQLKKFSMIKKVVKLKIDWYLEKTNEKMKIEYK